MEYKILIFPGNFVRFVRREALQRIVAVYVECT